MTRRTLPPIVVDLGKADREALAQLKEGAGPLVADLREVERRVVERLRANGVRAVVVPVVVSYKRP